MCPTFVQAHYIVIVTDLGPVSRRLLSGYEGLLSAKKVMLGNDAFHVVYLYYTVGATPYLAYSTYPRGVRDVTSKELRVWRMRRACQLLLNRRVIEYIRRHYRTMISIWTVCLVMSLALQNVLAGMKRSVNVRPCKPGQFMDKLLSQCADCSIACSVPTSNYCKRVCPGWSAISPSSTPPVGQPFTGAGNCYAICWHSNYMQCAVCCLLCVLFLETTWWWQKHQCIKAWASLQR
ncbi:hypothetical protein LSAT2_013149 [Lamellibrachia satsuma]|nr:hypothetical protein LSAT2_013149 [Lamellibrachia satsuma]